MKISKVTDYAALMYCNRLHAWWSTQSRLQSKRAKLTLNRSTESSLPQESTSTMCYACRLLEVLELIVQKQIM